MSGEPEDIFSRYEEAIRTRNARMIAADYAPGALAYDLAPPLQHDAAATVDLAGMEAWFAAWEDDLRVEHQPPTLLRDGDLAVLWALQHMHGTRKGEGRTSLWFRTTVAARRIEGEWKIAHIHTSVPFAMDGSGKAMLDLEPED